MKRNISRRKFVQATAAAAAGAALVPMTGACAPFSSYDPKGLPTVRLGKTGVQVPRLGFGCGSRWMAVQDDQKALEILETAFNRGMYYWDTASSYGNERISSEERIGMILKERRDKVFLTSKTGDRDGEPALRSIEQSLDRLGTDHIDLMYVHALSSVEDAEQLGEKGMVLEVLHRLKSEKVIHNIGFSGHASAEAMVRAVELYDFDVMMMALNHQSTDGTEDFEGLPAPMARGKGMGVVAMKAIRPRETVNGLAAADLVRYALSLADFHLVNIGIDSMEALESNLSILRDFTPLDEDKMNELRLALEPFCRDQKLPWMQPAYKDGRYPQVRLA